MTKQLFSTRKPTPPWVVFSWIWLSLLLSLGFAWHSLAQVDFGYAIWYEHGGIKEFIDKYAPKNKYRHDFALASKEVHLASFHGIVDSIQNHGKGLNTLSYQANGKHHLLLHKAEVEHLQDVANLLDKLNAFLIFSFVLWLMLFLYQFKNPFQFTTKQVVLSILTGSFLLSLPLFIFGAQKVFYQFHIWVFPNEHQWFFYYQDSLMSTMMKAPDLFAFIAILLVVTSLIIFTLLFKVTKTLHKAVK